MRAFSRSSSGCWLIGRYGTDAIRALAGGEDEVEPGDDHRQGQPLAHVQVGRPRELDEMGVRLADIFEREAGEAVDEDEGADQPAGLVAGAGLPEHPAE